MKNIKKTIGSTEISFFKSELVKSFSIRNIGEHKWYEDVFEIRIDFNTPNRELGSMMSGLYFNMTVPKLIKVRWSPESNFFKVWNLANAE